MSDEEWDVTLEDLEEDDSDDSTSGGFSLGSLFETALSQLPTVSGVQLFVLMIVVGLTSRVANETVLATWIQFVEESSVDDDIVQLLPSVDSYPLALDVPVAVPLVLLVVLPFLAEALRVVAIRVFDADATDGIPGDLARRNLPMAVLRGWAGGLALLIAIAFGSVLIVPGIFLAVTMVFYHQEVALEDSSIVAAMRGSWDRTKGHRWSLFGLLAVIVVIYVLLLVPTFVLPVTSPVTSVVSTTIGVLSTLFSIALVTAAYREL